MDANQDGNRTCPDSNRTCPDSWLEAYADWCESQAAEAVKEANTIYRFAAEYVLPSDRLYGMSASLLTAANLARGCYTGGTWN